jgi:putative DNA methylase
MTDRPRLIEVAFPLEQASLDSVHEKTLKHGHISSLHLWPARRPLAACRAALIATLLPDPGNDEERKQLLERIGGRIVKKVERKKKNGKVSEIEKKETVGGVLHWGRESSPDMDYFRAEIRRAYGGRPPRVLDPFAGGGAIPLEAMRLGCEAIAIDINPVAWFILKCTLEYAQKLAGQKRPLPAFILEDEEFLRDFYKSHPGMIGAGKPTKKQLETLLFNLDQGDLPSPHADLAWHVRAWSRWVLERARKDLAQFYPVVDGKPTVAYLWARTVECANCRATLPLLKTRWLCKKDNNRVLLTMKPNAGKTGVEFGIDLSPPLVGGNAAQRRESDKKLGAGTMNRVGATCPCCTLPSMEMAKIRRAGQDKKLGAIMTAVVVDGKNGKEYRLPNDAELASAEVTEQQLRELYTDIPFGLPEEPTPAGGGRGAGRAFSVQGYGLMRWRDLFTPRQLFALGIFLKHTRAAREALTAAGYPEAWSEAVGSMLQVGLNRLLDFANCGVQWKVDVPTINHSFVRFALPITWDYAEGGMLSKTAGSYIICLDRIATALDTLMRWKLDGPAPRAICQSAKKVQDAKFDVIVTDPPYYDAIPYSDLMDFFYVWTRRGWMQKADPFREPLAPKWNSDTNDGELIDDDSRHDGDTIASKTAYENGMADSFRQCAAALNPNGLLVIVFANKQPDAWEALVAALVKSGFVVDGSWPIQTEQTSRMRAQSSAALASSVWLVCKKRPEAARPGWDNKVLEEMRERIEVRLREFWDAGIRGPDFVWAATGPAMEAYSKHPVVKKANDPGKLMDVGEFLRHVRRLVVDFVVGRVLSHGADGQVQDTSGLDDPTTYYLLHRHDFGMDDAPVGPCILYAVSCGLKDADLVDQFDLLLRTGKASDDDEDEESPLDAPGMGFDPSTDSARARRAASQPALFEGADPVIRSREVPMIDKVHRLMHLWRAGDVVNVDEYIDSKGIRKNELFGQLLQALIELAPAGSEERSLMEAISNHLAARGVAPDSLYDRVS